MRTVLALVAVAATLLTGCGSITGGHPNAVLVDESTDFLQTVVDPILVPAYVAGNPTPAQLQAVQQSIAAHRAFLETARGEGGAP